MRQPTIKDVAKEAGVGLATVSRVVNGHNNVSPNTRQRVLDVIQKLGYRPNLAARQLSTGKTLTIGVITPFFTLPSFVERLTGVQEVLQESDYELILHSARSLDHFQDKLNHLINQQPMDGLIILSPPELDDSLWEISPNFPIVVLDDPIFERSAPNPLLRTVIDNRRGGEIVGEYLKAQGHTQIGFVGDTPENAFRFNTSRLRFEGLQNICTDLRPEWCRFAVHGRETAYQSAVEILSGSERPTAIFAASDLQAFGVLSASRELGLRVPQDVAVIGFDDIEAATYLHLTTIRQPLLESGRLGARFLLDWLDDNTESEKMGRVVQPLEVVERDTV